MISLARKLIGTAKWNVKRAMRKAVVPKHYDYGALSYSQSGEDMIMSYVLRLRGIEKPSYIDIGAHDPFYLSNTATFYFRGCRGVTVEPNPELAARFKVERPKDTNLNIGIGTKEEILDFYCMEDATLGTFSSTEAAHLQRNGKALKSVEKLAVWPLRKVIDVHCGGVFPDILSLDVEGMEIEILSQIDFDRNAPKIICAETAEYSTTGEGAKNTQVMSFIECHGYLLYGDTNLNSVYVRKEFWCTK